MDVNVKKSTSLENLKKPKSKNIEVANHPEKEKVPGHVVKTNRSVPVEKLREADFKERKEQFKKISLSRRLEVANVTINRQQEIIHGLEKKVAQIADGLQRSRKV